MFFEKLTASREATQAFARRGSLAIIATQIWQRLFAFENRGDGLLTQTRSVGHDIGAIPALWQAHFRRTGGVKVGLGPKKRETPEPDMRFRFAPACGYG